MPSSGFQAELPPLGCYEYREGENLIRLEFFAIGQESTAELHYELSGKDANHGMLKGKFENDLLKAEYTFMSEGRESIREVVFLYKNEQWMAGYGQLNEDGNRFINSDSLNFSGDMPLRKVECEL